MEGRLTLTDGTSAAATSAAVEAAFRARTPFWLDLTDLDEETTRLLADVIGIHPLAIEDAEEFGQRPKLESYDGYVHLVVHGAAPLDPDGEEAEGSERTVEVHSFYCERYLITIHRGEVAAFDQLLRRAAAQPAAERRGIIFLLYRVVDALVDSYFPVLDRLDDRIDEMEDEILDKPTDAQLGTLFGMKRTLVGFRKVITPSRDVFSGIAAGTLALPGMSEEAERYFRDIYDHVIRIGDMVDTYRDLLASAADTHLSVVSNRLNTVMKQLTVIATIFLPLSFLTGFFGQNFRWLVSREVGAPVFFGAGIGLEVLAIGGLLYLFRKRQWI